MKKSLITLLAGLGSLGLTQLHADPVMAEQLDRGLVGIRTAEHKVTLSWRLFNADGEAAFDVYRKVGDGKAEKVNKEPVSGPTFLVDQEAPSGEVAYVVRVAGAAKSSIKPNIVKVAPADQARPYLSIPLEPPADGVTSDGKPFSYSANDGSVGDLDGDGQLEIILQWSPSNAHDNSQKGQTGDTYYDAYKLNGTRLWRINMGKNIRSGAHYTPFVVADFDGDGKAEMICKTADGTMDATGAVVGDANADHRNATGYILKGPEFLSVFDGATGKVLATIPYAFPRHPSLLEPSTQELKDIWGDGYGNRCDRFLAGAACLDGKLPSAVMARGYYTRATLAAYDWREGKLTVRWTFDSDDGKPGHKAYHGQGNHNLSVADVDGDGKDEIVYGSAVYDDNGEGLYSTGWGHADALHVSDLVPSNPGLEVFNIQERADKQGMNLRDAKTGKAIFTLPTQKAEESGADKGEGPGRGVSFNIDPRYPGNECWARGAGFKDMYSSEGKFISEKTPKSCNFAIWWDGDHLRELLDKTSITKWNWKDETETLLLNDPQCSSNNGTKATPVISGDILGDWREEVVWRRSDNRELRIYTTTIPTKHRQVSLLEDHQYRMSLIWQNGAYNQPPHTSYLLDEPGLK